jgi:hypothetical protein
MTVFCVGRPFLKIKYVEPSIDDALPLVLARVLEWRGEASVRVMNEADRWLRIGFVQLLNTNTVEATYTTHRWREVLKPGRTMPLLDGPGGSAFRPFYDHDKAANVLHRPKDVMLDAGERADVKVGMWDRPGAGFDLFYESDSNDPLVELHIHQSFSTYVVVRDITDGDGINDAYDVKILKQWSVVVDRRISCNVVGTFAALDRQRTRFKVNNPEKAPIVEEISENRQSFPPKVDAIFRAAVANGAFAQVGSATDKVQKGDLVKARMETFTKKAPVF